MQSLNLILFAIYKMERSHLIGVIIIGIVVLMALVTTVLYYTTKAVRWRINRLFLIIIN
ncbi:hypothetical protein EhV318 [Emiliania huxleyi virus 86]|uniref:Putative membrane protein n=1 Tax=Emiliania huxleyi virus 86 (isolate United Kingdom/English Channel/1999) TaxID=654925 RepID=Q4A2G1_EHV8U|nr:hypothetical protein EhV318 [Emiliania huxleyi virus 86]CAI65745.1 putative membrane protein [Emiliania huxleyi virus 86]